jgi:hypothetical protein
VAIRDVVNAVIAATIAHAIHAMNVRDATNDLQLRDAIIRAATNRAVTSRPCRAKRRLVTWHRVT